MELFIVLSTVVALHSSAVRSDITMEELRNVELNQDIEITSDSSNAYWLFTRNNPIVPQIITHNDASSVLNSNYDPSKPLKVIAHGWTNDGEYLANTMITAAFLKTYDVNVIVLDWSVRAGGSYISACWNVPVTGRELGSFIEWLFQTAGGSWDALHLIGFSLGAHLVGNAGEAVGGKAIRVTGLDPAGPFWSDNPCALSTAAGRYVEAIHTNIVTRGITAAIAHADFYPNGGHEQPGCDGHHCAHARSYELFASSVISDHFVGRRCLTLNLALLGQCSGATLNMGNGDLLKQGSGIYALQTEGSWPF